ncbi:MAG: nitroreductase family protein [Desulfovibrionaceae bacterium]|nr:nitroreductase family protein [Desulfovibrionaceae bacterium]
MDTTKCLRILCAFLVFLLCASAAQAARTMQLPAPDKEGGMPLMQALAERKSTKSFSDKAVSAQDLSNLLWAAWGVNRPDGRRTAPSGRNSQAVDVYVVLDSGVWLYDASKHLLEQVLPGDLRAKVGGAPVTLLFAAPADDKWAGDHVGSIYQNAGLYCASAKMACVVRVSGSDGLKDSLTPAKGYSVRMTLAVGWPK